MSKYFLHVFIKGYVTLEGGVIPDSIAAYEIHSWEIEHNGILTHTKNDHPRGFKTRMLFAPGNRLYIVENHGQCMEPNGDIIWRNEDGNAGDEKAAA